MGYGHQIGINIVIRDCPAIVTKWHVGGIRTEEPDGIEICTFAVEARTVSSSSMQSLETLGLGLGFGLGLGLGLA